VSGPECATCEACMTDTHVVVRPATDRPCLLLLTVIASAHFCCPSPQCRHGTATALLKPRCASRTNSMRVISLTPKCAALRQHAGATILYASLQPYLSGFNGHTLAGATLPATLCAGLAVHVGGITRCASPLS
jgi:hypothetical protein